MVIGNPPYVLIDKKEFKKKYYHYFLQEGKIDLYRLFIEISVTKLVAHNGILAYITPNTFLTIPSCKKLRKYMLEKNTFIAINDYDMSIFNASVNSVVFVLRKILIDEYKTDIRIISKNESKVYSIDIKKDSLKNEKYEIRINLDNNLNDLYYKFSKDTVKLKDIKGIELCLGEQPYHNTIHSQQQIKSRFLHSKFKINNNYLREYGGKNIYKYALKVRDDNWLDFSAELYTKPDIKFFSDERIILREIVGKTLTATFVEDVFLVNKSVYIILYSGANRSFYLKYILALLNSKIIGFFVSTFGDKSKQALFPRITMQTLKNIPIKISIEHQQPIITLVNQILEAKHANPQADTSALEAQIDQLVYELYGLTQEEIDIIEGN